MRRSVFFLYKKIIAYFIFLVPLYKIKKVVIDYMIFQISFVMSLSTNEEESNIESRHLFTCMVC